MSGLWRFGVQPLDRPALRAVDTHKRIIVNPCVVGEVEIESNCSPRVDNEDRSRIRTELGAGWFNFEWVEVVCDIEHSRSSSLLQLQRSRGGDLSRIDAPNRRFTSNYSSEDARGEICPVYRGMRTIARIQSRECSRASARVNSSIGDCVVQMLVG